jgi:hypothetical protein
MSRPALLACERSRHLLIAFRYASKRVSGFVVFPIFENSPQLRGARAVAVDSDCYRFLAVHPDNSALPHRIL